MNALSARAPIPSAPPPDAAALLARAHILAATGRREAALAVLAALRRLGTAGRGSDAADADMLEAQLLIQAGRPRDALALLDSAIALGVDGAAIRLIRVEARLMADDPAGAATDAAEAVIAAPGLPRAKAALGIAMAELGHLSDALACLDEAVRAAPDDPVFRLALARAQELAGEAAAAAATLDAGIARAPSSLKLRNAALRLAIAVRDFPHAVDIARAAQRHGVMDACLFGMLGHALSSLGRHEAAGDAYAEALKLAPEDAYVRHLVAASGRLPPAEQAADDYVRVLFDGYAETFEAHVIGLGYRVPGLLREATRAHLPLGGQGRLGPVLDLGCGTGLAAVAMSDLPLGPWHGIDLSPKMLAIARATGLYDTLTEASLLAGLSQEGPDYAVAVAADVLCYVGALGPVLGALHRRLLPGGLLLASLESLPHGASWRLGPHGRYAHAPDHVAEIAARCGFAVRSIAAEPLRREGAAPVSGLITVLAKADR